MTKPTIQTHPLNNRKIDPCLWWWREDHIAAASVGGQRMNGLYWISICPFHFHSVRSSDTDRTHLLWGLFVCTLEMYRCSHTHTHSMCSRAFLFDGNLRPLYHPERRECVCVCANDIWYAPSAHCCPPQCDRSGLVVWQTTLLYTHADCGHCTKTAAVRSRVKCACGRLISSASATFAHTSEPMIVEPTRRGWSRSCFNKIPEPFRTPSLCGRRMTLSKWAKRIVNCVFAQHYFEFRSWRAQWLTRQ